MLNIAREELNSSKIKNEQYEKQLQIAKNNLKKAKSEIEYTPENDFSKYNKLKSILEKEENKLNIVQKNINVNNNNSTKNFMDNENESLVILQNKIEKAKEELSKIEKENELTRDRIQNYKEKTQQFKKEKDKKKAKLIKKIQYERNERNNLQEKLQQLQKRLEEFQPTQNNVNLSKDESNKIKQIYINKSSTQFDQIENRKLENKRKELEIQLKDLENEEAMLDREENDLNSKCKSLQMLINNIEKQRSNPNYRSYLLSSSLDEIPTRDNQSHNHNCNNSVEFIGPNKLKEKCNEALQKLRAIRRQKVDESNKPLLKLIEEKEDMIMLKFHQN